MSGQTSLLGLSFIALSLLGFYLAYLYGRKTKRFRWSEYIATLFIPTLFIFIQAHYIGVQILYLFFVSCVAGFLLEYIVGLTYHKTLNQRLWTYKRLSVGGYTSLLSIPIWGVAGVVF